jgi:hypothetical protein
LGVCARKKDAEVGIDRGANYGMSSIRLHVIIIEEVVLKQDVFISLLRDNLISQ